MRAEGDDAPLVAEEHERLIRNGEAELADGESPPDSNEPFEDVAGTLGWFVWGLTFSAGVSGLLFGYDTGVISSTLVSIGDDLSNRPLTTLDKSLVTSATSLFALLASPLAGVLADGLGRKKVILLADILFIIGAIWQAISSRVAGMIIGRSIVGAAVGVASFVAPMYISELAPATFRGRMVTIQVLLITFGQVVAYIVGWAFSTTQHGWRYMVGLGALPAIVQLTSVVLLPETPRWLVRAGRREQAAGVLRRILAVSSTTPEHRRESWVEHTLDSIEADIDEESDARFSQTTASSSKRGFAAKLEAANHVMTSLITIRSNRRALTIACMLQGAQQLTGFNSLMYFSATIFALVGFRSPTLTALSVATTNFVFTLVAFYAIDRVGRRRILLLSIPVMAAGLALCAFAFLYIDVSVHPDSKQFQNAAPSGSAAWPVLVLISMIVYVSSYATGLGNVPWQQSELFPLSVRSAGSSLATATNWGCNTVVGVSFLPMMEVLTPTGTFILYTLLCALSWVLVWSIYPETAGLGLEEVSGLLERSWAVRESVELFKSRRRRTRQRQVQGGDDD